jgi:hypothetical protein
MSPPSPLVIGWTERISFPDWHLRRVRVKIDTGARTSALGAVYYELRDHPDQGRVVDLVLTWDRKDALRRVTVTVPVLGMVVVRNSAGQREQRPLIEARVRLGPLTKTIRLTVTNRAQMRFPVILGRQALAGDFLVDVSRKNLLKRRKP